MSALELTISLAQSEISDRESGVDEGIYSASENADLSQLKADANLLESNIGNLKKILQTGGTLSDFPPKFLSAVETVAGLAESNNNDRESGIEEGIYSKSDNESLPGDVAAVTLVQESVASVRAENRPRSPAP